jgi:nicotinate-nucleotide--dimethylbenzimidazole phosphoribosyltransferase
VDALAAARVQLNPLTKPPWSLGRLEDIAAQWGSIRQQCFADSISKAFYVFAADHGVRAAGDSRI